MIILVVSELGTERHPIKSERVNEVESEEFKRIRREAQARSNQDGIEREVMLVLRSKKIAPQRDVSLVAKGFNHADDIREAEEN